MKAQHINRFCSSNSLAVLFSAAILGHFAAPTAIADTFYWDNNGATAGFGAAAGTWTTPTVGSSTQGWSTDATGATVPTNVTTTDADILNFGITATGLATGSITVSGTVAANRLVFASGSGTITLSGGTLALGGISPSITANKTAQVISSALTLNANTSVSIGTTIAAAFTLNGPIDGTGNLSFTTPNLSSGTNTQTINLGAASSYSGTTTITTGNSNNNLTVRASLNDALPATTVVTLDGGNGPSSGTRTVAYDLNGKNQTIAGLDNNKTRNAARLQRIINSPATAATLTVTNTIPASPTFSGNINGTLISVVKTGTGSQVLGGVNTYNGTTTISGGKLQGIVGGNCASSTVVIDNTAATLGVSVTDNTKNWTCAALTSTAAGTIEFDFGAITPSASVSPLAITGLANFTAASLKVKVNVAVGLIPGTYPLMTWGSVSGPAPATLDLTVPTMLPQTEASLVVSGNTLNLVIVSAAVGVLKNNTNNDLNLGTSWVGGIAPDANKLGRWNDTVTSANTTDLGANTAWAGISILNPAGLVTINPGNAGHTLTLGASAIQIDLGAATADLTLNCPLALATSHFWDVAASRTVTLGSQVSGAFGITKLGSGKAILSSSANSYTGDTSVLAGTVQIGTSNVIPDGVAAGNLSVTGLLDLNGNNETLNGLSGAGMIDNLAAATASTLTLGGNDQTSTFTGILKNTASTLNLIKTGTGTQVVSGANTLSGTVAITGGTLGFGGLANVSSITIGSGTALRPDVGNAVVNAPITLGAAMTTSTIHAPNTAASGTTPVPLELGGPISGAGNLTLSGISPNNAYGTIILKAASTYTGSTLMTCSDELAAPLTLGNQNIFVRLFVDNALPVTTVLTLDGGDGAPLASAPGRFCEFNLSGKNQTLGGLTNVAGRPLRVQRVVNNSATTATLTINNSANHTYSGQLGWVSGVGSTTYDNFNITKSGSGTQTFSGPLKYDGNTSVSAGTLSLTSANVNNDFSSVNIASTGAVLDLAFTGTDTVRKLFIGGAQVTAGVYGPSATNIPQITGTGTLTVTTSPAPGSFGAWQLANNTTQSIELDHDNDGVSNGVELFLGGSTNTTGFTPLPGVVNSGGVLSITWNKATSYTGTYDTHFVVQTSATLANPWTNQILSPTAGFTVTIMGNAVKYTFPPGTTNFARLKVTGP